MEIVVTVFAVALAATCTIAVVMEKLKRDRSAENDGRRPRVAPVPDAD